MTNNMQSITSSDSSSKILSLRLPPQVYAALKNRGAEFGLKPATFAKYAVISLLMNKKTEFNLSFETEFNGFLNSLPKTSLDEKKIMKLIEKERQAAYDSSS